jgi:hypothetical protein
MSDLLQTAAAWLTDQLQRHAAQPVVYQRGLLTATMQVTKGRTLLRLSDGSGGSYVQWTDRDYLIPAAALEAVGIALPPQPGDRILETVGSATQVYEVLIYGSEPAWRWADAHRQLLRIHTKHIEGPV